MVRWKSPGLYPDGATNSNEHKYNTCLLASILDGGDKGVYIQRIMHLYDGQNNSNQNRPIINDISGCLYVFGHT